MMKKLLLLVVLLGLFSVQATCQSTHGGTLAWGASPTPSVTYNVYRATATANTDGTFTPGSFAVVKAGVTALTYTDSGLAANSSFCWQVTAVSASTSESQPLGPACGTTRKDQASPPSGTLTLTTF